MTIIDSNQITQIIIDCAQKHLVPYFNNLTDEQIHLKDSVGDIVTQADLEMEENLIKRLQEAYPDVVCIGEESFDPRNADILKSSRLFVIDPLDGTNAFRHKQPGFAVMVSFLQKGELTHAWIHAPLLSETLFVEKDKGVSLNGAKVELDDGQSDIIVGSGHVSDRHRQEMQDMAERMKEKGISFASHTHACMDFLRFARGELDFIVYQNSYPWDVLPGVLIAHEIGGYAAAFEDRKDMMKDPFTNILRPMLYVRCKKDWDHLSDCYR